MTHSIHIKPEHWVIIKEILKQFPYDFYAFGSRVKHTEKRFSDLDLCYKEPIPDNILDNIRAQLENSNLPYTVDLIDWNHCSNDFKEIIKNDLTPFNTK